MSDNKVKSNFFRSLDKPVLTPVTGTVTGKIPEWIHGTLTRNGPGIQSVGPDHYKHLFDGLAVLHRYHIENGTATYNNRPLESDTYKKNMAAQRIVVNEFGTLGIGDPCDTLFNRFKSMFISGTKLPSERDKATDNCSVNVAFYGDQLYAMTESIFARRVDPTTLLPIGNKTRIGDYVTINHATAHPHILEDGTALNMGNNYRHKKGPHYMIIGVPPTYDSDETSFKNAKVVAEIPCRWKMYPCYYHSFGMTTDKIIFIEQPYCLSVPKIMRMHYFPDAVRSAFFWYPNEKTRFYIVSRSTGEIHPFVYETDKLFTFHHANAYEENGQLIVDVAGYCSGDFISNNIDVDSIQKNVMKDTLAGASMRRYVLPLDVPKDSKENLVTLPGCKATAVFRKDNIVDIKADDILPEFFEFPRINYKYNGKKYNYVYGVRASEERSNGTSLPEADILSKIDVNTGKVQSWTSKGIFASEPVFLPNTSLENPAEDDGVVLAALLHENEPTKTTLLILDAKNMEELAKVEFKTEGVIPSTFHGQWAGAAEKVHLY